MTTGGPPDEIFTAFARVSLPPAEAAPSSRTFREGKWTSATRQNCGFPCGDAMIFVATILVFPSSFATAKGTCSSTYSFSNASISTGCGYATISFALLISDLPHSKVFRAAPALNGGLVEGAFRRLLRRILLLNRSMLPAGRRPGATSGYAMHRE